MVSLGKYLSDRSGNWTLTLIIIFMLYRVCGIVSYMYSDQCIAAHDVSPLSVWWCSYTLIAFVHMRVCTATVATFARIIILHN